MGIRMALGAAALDVIRLVVRGAVIQLVIGVSIGMWLGIAAARLAGAVLFEVQPRDPAIIAIVIATLVATGLGACIVPAVRATKSDPVHSLRAE
jgi:putative ABC transport system permease protein